MARCGCASSSCNCVIQAGQNTAVSGAGTPLSPIVIDALDQGLTIVHDTATIDMSIVGDGKPGTPFDISGTVKVAPGINLIEATPDGLQVSCEAVADCIPPAGNIVTGCGLQGTGAPEAPLAVAGTQSWPFACSADDNGSRLYCTPSGALVADPPRHAVQASAGLGSNPDLSPAAYCANTDAVLTVMEIPGYRQNRLTVNNPDPCRSMIFHIQAGGLIRLDRPRNTTNASWYNSLSWGLTINGTNYTVQTKAVGEQSALTADLYLDRVSPPPPITVAPGGSLTIESYLWGSRQGNCELEFIRLNAPQISVMGVSL